MKISSPLKALLCIVFALAIGYAIALNQPSRAVLNEWLQPTMLNHLGAEYNSIAIQIVNGRGFCDPFNADGGPTAWMPPVLSYLLAIAYWVFDGDETGVITTATTIQAMAIATALYLLFSLGRSWKVFWSAAFIGAGGLAANFFMLFQMTHDTGLLLLMNCFLWLGLIKVWNGPGNWKRAGVWGAFGGLAALCSPVLGLVWAMMTAWRFLCTSSIQGENYHKPLTPNLSPRKRGERSEEEPPRADARPSLERRVKIEVGAEVRSSSEMRVNTRTRLSHLFIAALVSVLVVTPWTIRNYVVFDRLIPIKSNGMFELWQAQCADDDGIFDMKTARSHPYTASNPLRQEYAQLGEIAFIEAKAEQVKQAIRDNPMEYLQRLGNRFFAAFVYYQPFNELDEYNRKWPLFLKRFVFPLPLISLYVILLLAPKPIPPQVKAAITIWILTLIPYVLVSYYERYATPLLLCKLIVVLYAWSLIASKIRLRSKEISGI